MFTGIVTELGEVEDLKVRDGAAALRIASRESIADAAIGDSVSVNGCCLTVTELHPGGDGAPAAFSTHLMAETLRRTALAALEVGAAVNLEPALRAGMRLGGHLVQGHVDAVGEVVGLEPDGGSLRVTIALPAGLGRYVVEKGSVAVQGVSLTVTAADARSFSVGLIPHTLAVTALGALAVGTPVNVEVDVVAKYVERLLQAGVATPYEPAEQEHR